MADPSLLTSLPAEILEYILSYTVPRGLTFHFIMIDSETDEESKWRVQAYEPVSLSVLFQRRPRLSYKKTGGRPPPKKTLQTAPIQQPDPTRTARDALASFLALRPVNRRISQHIKALVLENNTFEFRISAHSLFPPSLSSPHIFGPLGAEHSIHLVRDLRSIRIVLDIDDRGYWAATRHRSRVAHFVHVLTQHAADAAKKSLLKNLGVCIAVDGTVRSYEEAIRRIPARSVEQHMFALEPLVALAPVGVEDVSGVPEWFAECLEMAFMGRGGVAEYDWPVENGKSLRKWHQPVLEWRAFARRNGVQVPEDIDRLWVVEK